MKVLYRIVTLILTLLTIDSDSTVGVAIFQFSSDLVFAIAKIQTTRGVRIPLNDPHPYTPDTPYTLQMSSGVTATPWWYGGKGVGGGVGGVGVGGGVGPTCG